MVIYANRCFVIRYHDLTTVWVDANTRNDTKPACTRLMVHCYMVSHSLQYKYSIPTKRLGWLFGFSSPSSSLHQSIDFRMAWSTVARIIVNAARDGVQMSKKNLKQCFTWKLLFRSAISSSEHHIVYIYIQLPNAHVAGQTKSIHRRLVNWFNILKHLAEHYRLWCNIECNTDTRLLRLTHDIL